MSERVKTGLCALLLLALPLLLFWSVTVGPNTLIPADVLYQFEPYKTDAAALGVGRPQNHLLADLVLQNWEWKQFMVESARNGELPLWNPHLFGGVPFLAAGQHSALYPPSLLYYVLPLEKAYGWYTVLNLWIAGLCMFALARGYGLSRSAAAFAGVAWQLSGFFAAQVVFQMMIGAAAWLPLILLSCDRLIKRLGIPWLLVGSVAIAMMLLAGHVEITIYTLLVAGAYAAHRLFWAWFPHRDSKPLAQALFAPGAVMLGMVLLGLALGAIQLGPLYELVTQNYRAARTDFATVLSYGFPKSLGWMRWLMPIFFGSEAQHAYFDWFSFATQPVPTRDGFTFWNNPARWKQSVEGAAYVGISTLMLAAFTVFAALRARFRNTGAAVPAGFFLVLALASVAFIFGTPLYAVLYYGLPGVNQLHSPFRWVFPLTLCLVVLAAQGLDLLRVSPAARRVGTGAMALALALMALLLVARAAWPAVEPFIAGIINRLELAGEGYTPRLFFSVQAANVAQLAFALAATGVALVLMARRARFAAPALVAVLAVDCLVAWWGFNPSVNPALLKHVPDAVKFLQQDRELWRFTTYDPAGDKPLNANIGWAFKFHDVRGYDSIITKQYVDYMRLIEPQNELLYNRIAPVGNRQSLESPLLDLLNVRYVLATRPIDPPVQGMTRVYDDGRTLIYKNERAMPRAFTLPLTSGMLTSNFGGAIQQSDPRRFVMIDASCGVTDIGCLIPRAAQHTPASITSYRNNDVWVDVSLAESSWLILADSYFPGWRAFVRPTGAPDSDEREVDILPSNGNFRAVRLDVAAEQAAGTGGPLAVGKAPFVTGQQPATPGPQQFTVRFRYSPDSVRIGAFASALGMALALFLLGTHAWRRLHMRASGVSSDVQRVARNSLTLTALSMLARVIDMAFAVIMLRYLGPDGNGKYTFAVVLVSWFEILMNFGLNTFLVRDVARDKTHAAHYFYRTTALRLLLALGAAPLVALVILAYRAFGGITPDTQLTILLLVLSQLPSSLATGLSALFFAHERAEIPAAFSIITALIKVVLGALALFAGMGIVGLAVVSIIGNVITMIALWIAVRRALGLTLSFGNQQSAVQNPDASAIPSSQSNRAILGESFPLMINHLLSTIYWKIDVLLLKALRDEASVGFYGAGYKYVDAFNIIPSLFTQSLFPVMSRLSGAQGNPLARTYLLASKLLLVLALPLSVSVSFLAGPLIQVLGGNAFLPHAAIALAIVIWHMPIGWINSVTNYALIATGQQRLLTRAFVGAVAFNIVANLIAIPLLGYVGAAIVTALSEVAQLATFYIYVRRFITRVNWLSLLGGPLLAAGIMATVAYAGLQMGLLLPALLLGGGFYLAAVLALRVFDAGERAILLPLLPSPLRRRLGLAP